MTEELITKDEQLWTTKDVADRWQRKPNAILRSVLTGEIAAIKLGQKYLFRRQDILDIEAAASATRVLPGRKK